MENAERFQIQLVLPYKKEARFHPRVRAKLAEGYRIANLQRVSDREVLITFARLAAPSS